MIKIKNKFKSIKPGDEFMVVSDHSCTLASIKGKYLKNIIKIDEVMIGVWEIFFKK
jgi:TusA-related sulfurtransferase